MKKLYVAAMTLLLGIPGMYGQLFKVESIKEVKTSAPMGAYHPVFTPDGKSLLVSSENYTGLALVGLETPGYKFLTDMEGAGYRAAISDDGTTVIARKNNLDEQTMDLYAIDMKSAVAEVLETGIDHTNVVTLRKGTLNYAAKGRLRAKGVSTRRLKAAAAPAVEDVFVTEEDLKIVVYRNGVPTVLDPLSTPDNDMNYCWTELSPDKKKVVFVAGQNAYTCNLDGSNLCNLGNLRAPQWRDNNFVVGMNDADDGHQLTSSDIVIVASDGTNYQQLTTPSSDIKMFPSVSADGNRIAFNNTKGELFIMTISEK